MSVNSLNDAYCFNTLNFFQLQIYSSVLSVVCLPLSAQVLSKMSSQDTSIDTSKASKQDILFRRLSERGFNTQLCCSPFGQLVFHSEAFSQMELGKIPKFFRLQWCKTRRGAFPSPVHCIHRQTAAGFKGPRNRLPLGQALCWSSLEPGSPPCVKFSIRVQEGGEPGIF